MKKLLLLLCIAVPVYQLFAQPFSSPAQVRAFADYLYCSGDYARAREEYQRLPFTWVTDTVRLLKTTALLGSGRYAELAEELRGIAEPGLRRSGAAALAIAMADLLPWDSVISSMSMLSSAAGSPITGMQQFELMLTAGSNNFAQQYSTLPSDAPYADSILLFHQQLANAGKKSTLLAAVLSALLPGAGKIYTGDYGDGITALAFTGLLAGLAVTNFNAKHLFRGWLFSGLAASYYAGTIYGSAAAAVLRNEKDITAAHSVFRQFASSRNYFLQVEFEFPCR